MLSSALQILAFALALLGVLGATVATLSPNWKVSADVGANIMTAVSQMQGLWMDCTWYTTGVFSCSLKHSVLALPAHLQAARTSMVLSCMAGSLGLCLAALGLKCTRWGGGRRAKAHTAVAAGGCFVFAGVLCLVPASWFTSEVITAFLDASVPDSGKYEPGGAVYVTFISAGFLLAAGVLFCMSCPGSGSSAHHDDGYTATSAASFSATSSSAAAAAVDPEKLRQRQREKEEQEREEKKKKEREEEEERKRREEEKKRKEEEEAEEERRRVQQQEQEKKKKKKAAAEESTPRERERQYYSPSRAPPSSNLKGRYSLQDYV
ncbi:claudin-20-like [Gadus macrocephalus]|uniref:claudin-20-like n=1 Tax=Gadus macrocephalus TaxID=80720 RepID=UPI0028CBBFC8|nr:claudin-20-like [Gadus macrocephalus]